MSADVDLRRQLTAAGVFLDIQPRTMARAIEVAALYDSLDDPLTDDEAEQLMVWLDHWMIHLDGWEIWPDRLWPGHLPPGWELTRHSWCPRCERNGDPLRWQKEVFSGYADTATGELLWVSRQVRRPRCAVFPPPPLKEIGPGCNVRGDARRRTDGWWYDECATRRLYRWGLRRA